MNFTIVCHRRLPGLLAQHLSFLDTVFPADHHYAGKVSENSMFDDARHCLEQPTVAEIIKCAEPYRY